MHAIIDCIFPVHRLATYRGSHVDGSFTFQGIYQNVNIRLSTLPIQAGEKCVLRLLQSQDSGQTLDSLEFTSEILHAFREIFNKPQGLFLITGPTGSGKTQLPALEYRSDRTRKHDEISRALI